MGDLPVVAPLAQATPEKLARIIIQVRAQSKDGHVRPGSGSSQRGT
jgi:hypothetical protein